MLILAINQYIVIKKLKNYHLILKTNNYGAIAIHFDLYELGNGKRLFKKTE